MVYTVSMIEDTPLTLGDLATTFALHYSAVTKMYTIFTARSSYYSLVDELAALDERLPFVVQELASNYQKDYPADAGAALAATVRLWLNPTPIAFRTAVCDGVEYTRVLDRITEVRADDAKDETCRLCYCLATLARTEIPLVIDLEQFTADFTYEWCEQHFPGSVPRMKACLAVDMGNAEENTRLSFYPVPSACTVALPEFTLSELG